MFSLEDRAARLCDGVSRRELLRIGGLGALGLSLPGLLKASETAPLGVPPTDKTFGRAKSVIYVYLQGGPPQHETFDPKPDAPVEIRGPFKPIQTNVPGIQFCELLPRTARMADKLAVVRSISTNDNNHDSSGYWLLTGYKYQGPNSRTIQPTDWPYFGSIVKKHKPSEVLPPLSTVWIPDIMRLNESVTPAGQTAGFLGGEWNPDRFVGDPSSPDYEVQGLELSRLPPLRLKQRETLRKQVESHFVALERGKAVEIYDKFQQQAYELMTSGKARKAFDIHSEPAAVRERYGRGQWSQCLLLARRLVEAGVRLVHVNWPREPGDNAVDNPLWDTHARNADRLEDVLCPQFDVGFTALIEDLDERGLLEETLVVAIGEFGRTPKINANGGRDHWGPVFSFALAGAGIRGGQVYGASDASGAYPARDRVEGGDLTATIFHLLGINSQGTFHDREGRVHKLTEGQPIYKLLGTEPATLKRVPAGGELARVPPYDDSLLLNTDFRQSVPLHALDIGPRPGGWRAGPLVEFTADDKFGVCRAETEGETPHVSLGFSITGAMPAAGIDEKAQALLAQQVRSPFAGSFLLSLEARCEASSREFFEQVFLKHFTCRLFFYQYTDAKKDPRQRKELSSLTLEPALADPKSPASPQRFELAKVFENPTPGANFSFGLGLGVAVSVEKTTPGRLSFSADQANHFARLRIDRLQLEFVGKKRKDDVTV